MRSYDFHRLLVIRFRLWSPNPWGWVGNKRRQLRYGDLPVHSLLWDIQVLHLRFSMFVLPPRIRPSFITEPHIAEGVHTVWRPAPHSRRLQCKPYVVCVMVLFGYCGIVGVLFYGRFPCLGSRVDHSQAPGRVSFFGGDNGACYIGLREPVSIVLLTYNLQVTPNHHVFNCSQVNTVLPMLSSPGCSCGQWCAIPSKTTA